MNYSRKDDERSRRATCPQIASRMSEGVCRPKAGTRDNVILSIKSNNSDRIVDGGAG